MNAKKAKALRKLCSVGTLPTRYVAEEVLDRGYKKKIVIRVDPRCPRGVYRKLKKAQ
jgi:hypothetical protein